jgi:hypothetical protein
LFFVSSGKSGPYKKACAAEMTGSVQPANGVRVAYNLSFSRRDCSDATRGRNPNNGNCWFLSEKRFGCDKFQVAPTMRVEFGYDIVHMILQRACFQRKDLAIPLFDLRRLKSSRTSACGGIGTAHAMFDVDRHVRKGQQVL